MPLRPVSELGLVDLTDLAYPDVGDGATRGAGVRPRASRASAAKSKGPASTSGRRAAKAPQGAKRSAATPKRSPESRPAGGVSKRTGKPASEVRTRTSGNRSRSRAGSRIALSIVTGALGVAGGLLLSRGALQR